MHIFIDESGTFVIPKTDPPAFSAVGALTIPDGERIKLEEKYNRLREDLPKQDGEVKGRDLQEHQIAQIVALLVKHQVLFEASVVELSHSDGPLIAAHQEKQARGITKNITPGCNDSLRASLLELRRQVENMPPQLYVQSTLNQDVIAEVIGQHTLYYAQRRPRELSAFHWVIDAKGPSGVTPWETWWSTTMPHLLESRSLRNPNVSLKEADYSHFERYKATPGNRPRPLIPRGATPYAVNVKLLLTEDFRFSSLPEPGLELVDILVNATRRVLRGTLSRSAWRDLPRLMIHRPHQYIHVLTFDQRILGRRRNYFLVLEQFQSRGKPILAPRFASEP